MPENTARRYMGRTAAEAISRIKAELGPDAAIISQKVVPSEGLLGAGGPEMVEIWAQPMDTGARVDVSSDMSAGAPRLPYVQPSGGCGGNLLDRTYGSAGRAQQARGASLDDAAGGMRDYCEISGRPAALQPATAMPAATESTPMLADIRSKLEEILHFQINAGDMPSAGEALRRLYLQMVENDVAKEIARELVERLNRELSGSEAADSQLVREAMIQAIARLIPANGALKLKDDGTPLVVAIVGPTGVGKTTTIAKLAVDYKVRRNKRVALITEDTHRPGGEEQLQTVARLLGIQLVRAHTAEQARAAIKRLRANDLILIDTAGRVPRHAESLEELATFLHAAGPDEVHLALSSLNTQKHLLEVAKRFAVLEYDRFILTKLDEAASYGIILNVAMHVERHLSYVTTGQEYMEYIEPGEANKLARLVLGMEQVPVV